MSVSTRGGLRNDVRGGIEAALQGAPTLVMPGLLFVGILGPLAGLPGLWGTLVAVALVPVLRLALGGTSCVMAMPRTASTATFVAMALHLGLASSGSTQAGSAQSLDLNQLRMGLAAASLMYLLASVLVALSGFLRLGRVFKMIPTPVTIGISNGTALLLLSLALSKLQEDLLPAAAIAIAMLLANYAWTRLQPHVSWAKWVPSVVVSLAVGLLGVRLLDAWPPMPDAAEASGVWAGAPWASVLLWDSLDMARLDHLLMLGIPGAITLALLMVLETFTTASTMETRFGARSQADRELIALGTSNVVGALLGSVPCAGSPVYSTASWLAGGRGKWASWVCFASSGAALVLFHHWIMHMPVGLAAGMLVLQATLLVSPVFIQSLWSVLRTGRWYKPSAQDMGFWIAVLISIVGFFGNLIWACFAGVGLSCLAVLRRVSVNLTAHWLYLDALRSRRIRTRAESDALTHLAHDVGVLRLSGHLFFGNSARIMQLADELHEGCACVVIDVSLVQDADPSGLDALAWLSRTLLERGVRVVISGMAKTRVTSLQGALAALNGLQHAVDLDRGLENGEDWVLQNATALPSALASLPIAQNTLLQGLSEEEVTAVLLLSEQRQVQQGEALFHKDERSDGVWMLQSGQVSILAGAGPQATRLATFGPGQFVGEMGFIDGNTRSATATADAPVQAILLDNQAIAALVRDAPQAALKITRNIARELAQRVRSTSAVLAQEADAPHSAWSSSVLGMTSKTVQ